MEGVNFAVEVPGDANPLTLQELCRVLQSATSHDHAQRQAAGQQISSWEHAPRFLSSLQTVYLDKSLPLEVRFQAIIQLKNNIEKRWRLLPRLEHGMPLEEKDLMRSRLFQGTVQEEEKSLALHNALVTAKIIRMDYPNSWPTALSDLIALLRAYRQSNQEHLCGTLQLLLRATKEMASIRLRRPQSAMQQSAPEISYVLAEIYAESMAMWMAFLSDGRGDEDAADMAMRNSLVSLRIMRRLIMIGFSQPHRDQTVQEIWRLTQTHFGQLLNFVSHDSQVPAPYQTEVGKHLLQYTKLHIDMSSTHPASFAFLPDSLPLVHAYWDLVAKFAEVFDKSGGIRVSSVQSSALSEAKSKVEGPLLERLALRGLLLLRACVKIAFQPTQTFVYVNPEVKEEQKKAEAVIKNELLRPELVLQITNVIIIRLFLFRKSDLEAWEESPEEWELQEQQESMAWEWSVRPCAEKLFLDLLTNYKEMLIPPLLEYFGTAANSQSDIATKDAVYTAMGLSAAHVHAVFDFDSVLASTVIQDAQLQGPLNKVLRRRITILVSQWVAVKISPESRPLVYQLFRHLMNPGDEANDEVVRITAARQSRLVFDDLDFNVDAFLPYASDMISWMIDLVKAAEIDETKLAILESLRIAICRMEEHVASFSDHIMAALPSIWDASGPEEFMIKQAITAIFSALANSLGLMSDRYHQFMIPLLTEALNPGSSLYTYLLDETLDIWDVLVQWNKPPVSRELLQLAPMALPVLEFDSPNSLRALTIVESYVLLAPAEMLGDGLRRPSIQALSGVITTSSSREHVRLGTVSIQNLIRSAAEIGGAEGVSVVAGDMVETGMLREVMARLHGAHKAHEQIGSKRKASNLNVITEEDYFAILARIALADPSVFIKMLASLGEPSEVWKWLSKEWFYFRTSCDNIERGKLYLLGLTRLLELPRPMLDLVLESLQDFIEMWCDVIMEIQDGVVDAQDSLIWTERHTIREPGDFETPKMAREEEVECKDPIHTLNAMEFVKTRLQGAMQTVGGEGKFLEEWMVNVDQKLADAFMRILNRQPLSEADLKLVRS